MIDIIINRITEMSKSRGVKPTVCMKESGVGKDFFVNLRKGQKPSVEKITKLADYFGVTTDYILGRSDIMKETVLNKEQPQDVVIIEIINYIHKLSYAESVDVLKYIRFITSEKNDSEAEMSDSENLIPAKEKLSKKIYQK